MYLYAVSSNAIIFSISRFHLLLFKQVETVSEVIVPSPYKGRWTWTLADLCLENMYTLCSNWCCCNQVGDIIILKSQLQSAFPTVVLHSWSLFIDEDVKWHHFKAPIIDNVILYSHLKILCIGYICYSWAILSVATCYWFFWRIRFVQLRQAKSSQRILPSLP
jgi:hypothetical protein